MSINSVNFNLRPAFGCNNPNCTPCKEAKRVLKEHGAKPECIDKYLDDFAPSGGLQLKKDESRIKLNEDKVIPHKKLVEALNITRHNPDFLYLLANSLNDTYSY